MDKRYSLINSAESTLIVIDVQDAFLSKLPQDNAARLLNNICWLVDVAKWRQIPLVVTAEEMYDSPPSAQLIDHLPEALPIYDKLSFGLAAQPNIMTAVERTERKTAVLVGLETDVCVLHSALGLLEKGYRVAVVTDAVGSPEPNHALALQRLQNAGIVLLNMKGLFYEWLRTVDEVNRFHAELPHMRGQAGVVL